LTSKAICDSIGSKKGLLLNTCKTCKHWVEVSDGRTHDGWWCASGKLVDTNQKPCPKDGAVAYDAESYAATIMVGPDFGCIHHEEKEALKSTIDCQECSGIDDELYEVKAHHDGGYVTVEDKRTGARDIPRAKHCNCLFQCGHKKP